MKQLNFSYRRCARKSAWAHESNVGRNRGREIAQLTAVFSSLVCPAVADAYVGPAAGISLLGALIGLISVIGIVLLGSLRWIIHRFLRVRPGKLDETAEQSKINDQDRSADDANRPNARIHGVGRISLRIAYIVIGILIGALFAHPRDLIDSLFISFERVITRFGDPVIVFHTEIARYPFDQLGGRIYEPDAVSDGLNLEVSATGGQARLLDMNGRELHRWHLSFDAIGRAWSADGRPLTDLSGAHWRRVKALPNGDLLVLLSRSEANPYGLGIVKLDWDSAVKWMAPDYYHHSIDIGPDGRIYTLYQEVVEPPVNGLEWMSKPFLNEGVAILTADGQELERINIIEAFIGTPFESVLRLARQNALGDPLHMNTVAVVSREQATSSDIADVGQLLVSIRNINTLAVIDPDTRKVVWADTGLWIYQHEPVLTQGNGLLVFDNLGPASGNSRVIEWDTAKRKPIWQWSGTDDMPLRSMQWGSVSVLDNGNRLVTETEGGRAIEITRTGQVAWEWRSDHRFGENRERIGRLMEMTRLSRAFFVGREATLLKPVR